MADIEGFAVVVVTDAAEPPFIAQRVYRDVEDAIASARNILAEIARDCYDYRGGFACVTDGHADWRIEPTDAQAAFEAMGSHMARTAYVRRVSIYV